MEASFGSSGSFNGRRNNNYQQNSRSMNPLGMPISTNVNSANVNMASGSLQYSQQPSVQMSRFHNNSVSIPDSYHVGGDGLLYSSRQYSHQGSQSIQFNMHSSRDIPSSQNPQVRNMASFNNQNNSFLGHNMVNSYNQASYFSGGNMTNSYDQSNSSLTYQLDHLTPSASHQGSQYLSDMALLQQSQQAHQDYYRTWPGYSEVDKGALPGEEDFDDTESCCDQECTMADKCSDSACDTSDACTDQNCPDNAPAPEVVVGAAALLNITHSPGHQEQHTFSHDHNGLSQDQNHFNQEQIPFSHHQDIYNNMNGFDFSSLSGEGIHELWTQVMNPVAVHLMVAHQDPNSSTCTRPCLLDDPHIYPICPMPTYVQPHEDLSNTYNGHPYAHQSEVVKCGAELRDPQQYIEHFNLEHRQFFETSAQRPLGNHTAMRNQSLLTSAEASASSPETALGSPESGDAMNTPSPLTPMSNDAQEEGVSNNRHMSIVSTENNGNVHQCLWRDEDMTEICGHVAFTAEDLFLHVSNVHIKNARRGDLGFRCGWHECPRSEADTAGFPQRSKIERHMQTHIECKSISFAILCS